MTNELQAHAHELLVAKCELIVAGFESAVAEWLSRDNGYKNESIRVRYQKLRQREVEKKMFDLNSYRQTITTNI